jgi:hypothetical protein
MILILVRVQGFLPRHDPNTACYLRRVQIFLQGHDPYTVCDLVTVQIFLQGHDPNTGTSAESKFSYRGMILILLAPGPEFLTKA